MSPQSYRQIAGLVTILALLAYGWFNGPVGAQEADQTSNQAPDRRQSGPVPPDQAVEPSIRGGLPPQDADTADSPRFTGLPVRSAVAPAARRPLTGLGAADVENGRKVMAGAAEGLGPGQACFTCHGYQGAADPSGAFPRLAGQVPWYMYKQLADYASGRRANAIMTPIAQALTDQQMQDVSAYYAVQTDAPVFPPPPNPDGTLLQIGGALSAIGSAESGIQACVNCHGPAGAGVPPAYPQLAGQYATYLEQTLRAYRSGERNNSPLNIMGYIASRMSDEQIRGAALYFAHVGPIELAGSAASVTAGGRTPSAMPGTALGAGGPAAVGSGTTR